MADGALTLAEFRKLTHEEKAKRYGELSAADRFGWRVTEPTYGRKVPCGECIHRIQGSPACEAYPKGWDADHLRALVEDSSIECGNGFHFEKKIE